MKQIIKSFAIAMTLSGLAATNARADVVISATPAPVIVSPGGTGLMSFFITTDNSDTLSQFQLELEITPVGAPSSVLQFTQTQPDPFNAATYVFAGQSFFEANSIPFWNVSNPPNPFTTIIGGDLALNSCRAAP